LIQVNLDGATTFTIGVKVGRKRRDRFLLHPANDAAGFAAG
jgi:hypothetical protein